MEIDTLRVDEAEDSATLSDPPEKQLPDDSRDDEPTRSSTGEELAAQTLDNLRRIDRFLSQIPLGSRERLDSCCDGFSPGE